MRKLVWEDDVEEIDLGDGDFITVSSQITIKEMAALNAGQTQMQVGLTLLKGLVRSWRGPSFEKDGVPVEVTIENIERLSADVAMTVTNHLSEKIGAEVMTEDEKKVYTSDSLPISTTP